MKNYILAFDQGTTSSRAIVFDKDGMIVGTSTKGVYSDISKGWMGRARCHGDLGNTKWCS
jgi:Glycerol kinase